MTSTSTRPKLQLAKTKGEWLWDIVGYSFYFGSLIFLLWNWQKLPSEVPAHYNALGEVDRWGSKFELFILPMIGAFIGIMMQFLEKRPHLYNYPERLNASNAEAFYKLNRKMLNQVKNLCFIIFALILIESITIALGMSEGLGAWFLPVVIASVFIPMLIGMMQQRKIQ